jgi:hypothetical protein
MKSLIYSKAQSWQLRSALESNFGKGNLMKRNGGTLALHCPNPHCPSHNRSNKFKLEVHLPSGLFSCWTCDLKGILRSSSNLLKFTKNDDLNDWVNLNTSHLNSWVSDAGLDWASIMQQAIMSLDENLEDEGLLETHVDLDELPERRLVTLDKEHVAWSIWNSRWGKWSGTEKSKAAAWRYDVHVKINHEVSFAFPAWDGKVLKGVHWWHPQRKIHYSNVGDRSQMILAKHSIDWKSPLYLVEGVWDALQGGQNAVPLLGSTLPSNSLLKRLLGQYRPPQITIVLDPDAQEKAWMIARTLNNMGLNTNVLCPPENNDPCDMQSEIVHWMNEFNILPLNYGWQSQLEVKLANL